MANPRPIKRIAESTHSTPLADEETTRYGITTPANESRGDAAPIDVYVYTPGGEEPILLAPDPRIVCKDGIRLASLTQFQWQEINNGVALHRWFVAVHPGVTVEPGETVPKFATVASLVIEEDEETGVFAIDTRLRATFTQPEVTAPAWEADTEYEADARVANDGGKLYVCAAPGMSASSGGPSGTGSSIADNAASWDYVGETKVTIDVYDQEGAFPEVGQRLFVEGGGWYEIAAIVDEHLVDVINLGLPGAIVTLAS